MLPSTFFLEHRSFGWFAGGNDLSLHYAQFNKSCGASYYELCSISHLVPFARNNFHLHFKVLPFSLILRLTLKKKWTWMDASYIPDIALAIDIGYLCKMTTVLWRRYYFSLFPLTFHSTMKKPRLKGLRNLATTHGGGRCELGGLGSPNSPSSEKDPQCPEEGIGTWPSSAQPDHSLGSSQLRLGEEANCPLMVTLVVSTSSWFHHMDKASLGEIMLSQSEM